MSEIDDLRELIGKPGESVPVVDAADIKVMWTYCQELKAQHPEYAEGGTRSLSTTDSSGRIRTCGRISCALPTALNTSHSQLKS